jgi:hypothetical protein
MLYLAQIYQSDPSKKVELQLLARQTSQYAWATVPPGEVIASELIDTDSLGALVLVELTESGKIANLEDAKNWILQVIDTFLSTGVTPDFLQQETGRAEQWRQTLTLQSQELDRRTLELEARREQIQQLEENLKREKKQMEQLVAQFRTKVDGAVDAAS